MYIYICTYTHIPIIHTYMVIYIYTHIYTYIHMYTYTLCMAKLLGWLRLGWLEMA